MEAALASFYFSFLDSDKVKRNNDNRQKRSEKKSLLHVRKKQRFSQEMNKAEAVTVSKIKVKLNEDIMKR